MAAWLSPARAGAQTAPKSRLVIVKHAGATDDQGAGIPGIVNQMMDRAIRELAGKDSVRDAWSEFVSPDDVVGIKVNPAGPRLISTQPCVVNAIVAGLVEAGVKENNIIIWDRSSRELTNAGYTLSTAAQGVRCYGTDKGEHVPGKEDTKQFYAETGVPVADKSAFFSKILLDEITALINVPVVKEHILAGISCAMKNHYGSIANPRDLHLNYCDPYVAELNATAPIKTKTRLIIADGLRSLFKGGPTGRTEWTWRHNAIIASKDPVAVDALALRIIEDKRKEKALDPIGNRARHVATAARIGLGANDPAQIDLREINLSV
jgi:uncharacterized protein (DUF362 family)